MTTPHTAAPHINQIRQHLLDTLAALRNPTQPMEVDRARAVAQVASVLVDTARVEVDYIKATKQQSSHFLEQADTALLPHLGTTTDTTTGPTSEGQGGKLTATGVLVREGGVTTHRMRG